MSVGNPRTLDPAKFPCQCVSRHVPALKATHQHHIVPLGWGGPDTAENVVPLCLVEGVPVLTDQGWRPIESIGLGSRVLGHDLRFHRVLGAVNRVVDRPCVSLFGVGMTVDHPLLTRTGWLPVGALVEGGEAAVVEPLGEVVEPDVFRLVSAEPEVLESVVVGNSVDVVDNLAPADSSPKVLLHDKVRPQHGSPLVSFPHAEDNVSPVVPMALALPFEGSGNPLERSHATGVRAVERLLAFHLGRQAFDGASALVARGLDPAPFPTKPAQLRTARSRAGVVGVTELGGGEEVRFAHRAGSLFHDDVLAFERRWQPFDHVEPLEYSGRVFDITVAGSHSFVAGGLVVHNCPSNHDAIHRLLNAYRRLGGPPPDEWTYNRHVRTLAAEGYRRWQEVNSSHV